MKTIIVATDFSNNADNALHYAGALAACVNARIIIHHFLNESIAEANLSGVTVLDLVSADKARLAKLAAATSAKYGVAVEYNASIREVIPGLQKVVSDSKADLVVAGMHTNDWSDRAFGNTATAILSAATYPVLVVPEKANFNGIERILFAYDTNNIQKENILDTLKDFADNVKATVTILHIETNAGEKAFDASVTHELEGALANVSHEYKTIAQQSVIAGIEKGIEELDAHLVVMVPHKLNFWDSILHNSKTRAMALRTPIPLLALPAELQSHFIAN